ncbi:MAG TPA: hypothetical protein VHI54_03150 [Actinomycetota bacterium]|nr:hypothetical protein [Actinomycetota bacterium]
MKERMKDVTGADLNEAEQKLVEAYRILSNVLMGHRDELSPFEERNTIKALAALWQVMNGLDMDPGQVYELGA